MDPNKMMTRVWFVLPFILSVNAIIVYNSKESNTDQPDNTDSSQSDRISKYGEKGEKLAGDSYVIPSDHYRLEEVLPDSIVTPATYLLPPALEQQTGYYYAPTESGEQTDWYPVQQGPSQAQPVGLLPPLQQAQAPPIFIETANDSKQLNIPLQYRGPKSLQIPVPSLILEPPSENASDDYIITVPSKDLELPAEEIDHTFAQKNRPYPIPSHLIPPHLSIPGKHKNPTKLYPKKFYGAFKPVPIPIAQFNDDTSLEVPKAKPIKYFKPLPGYETAILTPLDEKKIFQYQENEKKRKNKGEEESAQEAPVSSEDNYNVAAQSEQDVSETNHRYPPRNIYHQRPSPAPLREEPTPAPKKSQSPPAPDDRTEFRMHGMKGPHSYQFGYDTGKGKNRQFRFEERDNDGLVHGHYGYMDRHGKLRVVNYSAHPEHGFHAEPQQEEPEQ